MQNGPSPRGEKKSSRRAPRRRYRSLDLAARARRSERGAARLAEPLVQRQEKRAASISTWNTSKVTDFSKLFMSQKGFNDDISAWDACVTAR